LKRILFFLNSAKQARPVLLVASKLSERADVHVVCPDALMEMFTSIHGVHVHEHTSFSKSREKVGRLRCLPAAAVINARLKLAFDVTETFRALRLLNTEAGFWEKFLWEIRPEAVVIPCDRTAKYLPLLHFCRKQNLPSTVLVHAQPTPPQTLGRLRRDKCRIRNIDKVRAYFRDYPLHFSCTGLEGKVSFYSLEWMVALHAMKFLPENPWALGSGTCSAILALNVEMQESLERYGCPAEKICLTGHPDHDPLLEAYENRKSNRVLFDQKYGTTGRKAALLALPQLFEHGLLSLDEHMKEMRFLAESLARCDTAVWVSLHPRMERKRYTFLETDYGFSLCTEPLSLLLPSADLFLACYSSTVHWAALCSVPTLCFDFYGLEPSNDEWMRGLAHCNNKNAFYETIYRMLNEGDYCHQLKYLLCQDARRLGPFDGKCGERIVNALTNEG
jgi:hypothetical protein